MRSQPFNASQARLRRRHLHLLHLLQPRHRHLLYRHPRRLRHHLRLRYRRLRIRRLFAATSRA